MSDPLIGALLGDDPAAVAEDVSLATPLTSPRITGRDAVVAALGAYAEVMGATDADLRLQGEELEGAVFTTTVDGHTAQVMALVTHDEAGLIATIDIYGRPWPYMALVRDRIARLDPNLADPDLGTSPYVPEGPGTSWTDAPVVPPFADDVTLVSPLLSTEVTGKAINERILAAASQCYREQKFRAVLQVEDQPAIAAVVDEVVEGNVLQLVEIFTLNAQSEVSEIRIFSRPWPVTAYFRKCMYELLKDTLGPEFWQGPDPEGPLPIR